MILVAGSMDRLEYEICYILASRGISIRALIRNKSDPAWAESLKNFGATLAPGDLHDSAFLADACVGVNEVICSPIILPSSQQGIPTLRNIDLTAMLTLVNAAMEADVLRFVYISFSNQLNLSFPARKGRRVIEQYIIESGLPYTILHAGDYKSQVCSGGAQLAGQFSNKELASLVMQALGTPEWHNTIVELDGLTSFGPEYTTLEITAKGV